MAVSAARHCASMHHEGLPITPLQEHLNRDLYIKTRPGPCSTINNNETHIYGIVATIKLVYLVKSEPRPPEN